MTLKAADGSPLHRSSWDVIKSTIGRGGPGPLALWRGAVPLFLGIGPHSVLQFYFWERLSSLVGL
jgi:hypothetical protein